MKEERKGHDYTLAHCIFETDCSWIGNHIIKHSENSLKSENPLIVHVALFNLSKICEEFRDGNEKALLISFTGKVKAS